MKNKKRGNYAPIIPTSKDKQLFINHIVKTIETQKGLTLDQLQKVYSHEALYRIGLYYFNTTNKAICTALGIPVESGTRRKRDLEKNGLLETSIKKMICPITQHHAHFLTTNPDLFFINLNSKSHE